MKKTKIGKRIAAIGISVITAFTLIFGIGFFDFSADEANDSVNMQNSQKFEGGGANGGDRDVVSAYADSTSNLIYDSASKLYTFQNGESYWYIDYASGIKLGEETVDTDIVSVTVDSSAAKGSNDNPYVINSKTDWSNFVTFTATAANQTKTYVLNADLDYAQPDGTNGVIESVKQFQGRFYGNGHKISNATYSSQYSFSSNVVGLFAYATGTTYFSDLVIENLSVSVSKNPSTIGGLIGHTDGNVTVTDVVVTGNFTGTSLTGANVSGIYDCANFGGILGSGHGAGKTLSLYKCAADMKFVFNNCSPTYIAAGGLVGWYDGLVTKNMAAFNMYDCYSAEDVKHTGDVNDIWTGIVGFLRFVNNSYFKRCLSVSHVVTSDSGFASNAGSQGSLFCLGEGNAVYHLDHCYSYGSLKTANTVARPMPMVGRWMEGGSAPDFTNSQYYSETSGTALPAAAINSKAKVATSLSELKTAAKSALKNPSIWASEEIDKITATSRPNIIETPILINRIRAAYFEYKNGRDEVYNNAYGAGETAGDYKEVKFGQALPVPAQAQIPAGRVFLGWTIDKTGETAPVTEVPKTWHGDNKLYAVWGIDTDSGVTARADIVAHRGGTALTYGENGFESVYTTNGIRLSIDGLEVSGVGGSGESVMTDAVDYEWQWVKGSTNIESGTQSTYTVRNVRDSDTYKVTLKYRSESEPLFMGTLTLEGKKVTLNKAPLYLDGFEFGTETGRPYSGAPYSTSVPTATVRNSDNGQGEEVTGTTTWYQSAGRFNSADADKETSSDIGRIEVRNGKVYQIKTIWFECDEKYNGNYGDPDTADDSGTPIERNGQKFEIEFEVEYVRFMFTISDYKARPTVYVNLQYGQNYTYYNIAALFEEAFKGNFKDFPGLSPVFRKGTDEWTINEYRNTEGTAYKNVKEDQTLTVEFREEKYRVTYDPKNGEDPYEEAEPVGYGIRLSVPKDPENGEKLFLGWYYKIDEVDGDGNVTNVEKKWDFNKDVVMREVNLYAKWLTADTLVGIKVEIDPSAAFRAGEALDPSFLTVTATFSGTNGSDTYTSEAVLTSDQYLIDYGESNTDGRLHVVTDDGTVTGRIMPTTVKIRYTTRIGGRNQTAEETRELDLERIKVDTSKLAEFFRDTTAEYAEGQAHSLEITRDDIRRAGLTSQITNDVTYVYSINGRPVAAEEVVEDGVYTVQASFTVKSADYEAPPITATLTIVPEKIVLSVIVGDTEFVYNGKAQIPAFTFKYAGTEDEAKPNYTVADTHGHTGDELDQCLNAVKVGSYSIKIVLDDSGYKFENGNDFLIVPFTIAKAKIDLPEMIEPLEYIGAQYDLNNLTAEQCEGYFKNFNPDIMQAGEGGTGTGVGTYTAFITLKDPSCAEWSSPASRVTMEWEIKKAQLSVYWGNQKSFEENGEVQYPKVVRFIGLVGTDSTAVDLDRDVRYNLTGIKAEVGGYTVSMSFTSEASWAKNYELDDTKSFSFAIVPMGSDGDFTLVKVEWGTTKFKFNEDWQKPEFKLITEDGNENITADLIDSIMCNGELWELWNGNMWAGKYDITLSIDPESEAAGKYFLVGKPTCQYTILKDGNKGENPNPDDNNPIPPDGGIDPPSENTNELPLWQLIVGGVSAILFVVCASKAFGEYGKLKAAKKEAKELAEVSYAVTYSFAPAGLMAISFLGAGENIWTAVACALAGLFAISFAAMLLLSKKRKAAELVVRREKARIEEEKEYARQEEQQRRDEEQMRREEQMREEQRRRDEEFKMMFAAMQQGYQQPMVNYDDMQNMIASAMTAMLPAMQQQMQALPPAGDASQYAAPAPAPQQYAAPAYAAPAPAYGAPVSGEAEELRAQMAQQQAQMAQQQARMEAQMAQQQELINQLLQKQGQPAAPAQAYDPAEEAAIAADAGRVELLSQFGDGETPVSLEESYGKLSDDLKRFYYEIGCYIMERPNVMQNDGKYAVLFKYRGKTLFKLSIKNDAPVLTYILNGAPAEQRVPDENSLNYAKQLMSMCIAQTDEELDG